MQCVILAGGLGTRMQAVSQGLPKSLINVHEKPFIHYQLEKLRRERITDVLLCIGYQGHLIQRCVGNGARWKLNVRYLDEKNQLRGTGGALRWAVDKQLLEPLFFLMYGDSYLPIAFQPIFDFFRKHEEEALMTILHNQGRWDSSNASFDGTQVRYKKSKPPIAHAEHIDYGLSILRRISIAQHIPSHESYDLARYYENLSRRHQLLGYEVKERFYEIGSPRGLADFQTYIAQHPLSKERIDKE